MEDWENIHVVAGAGFLLAMVFGAVANRTNFCTMGAVSDWVNMGLKGRLGAWVLAMGVAVLGTQALHLAGLVDLTQSIYRGSTLGLGGYIIGGVLFGIGMTLGGGCGQKTLVRVGAGNLKSVVVMLMVGISAYMTLRGLLGIVRVDYIDPLSTDLASQGIDDQGLPFVIAALTGIDATPALVTGVAILVGVLMIGWAFLQPALRGDLDNLLGGLIVGLVIVGGWAITGILGFDDFDPVQLESMSFVAPTGNALVYLMTYTGATINFGIAIVGGVIAGSFVYAVLSRTFSIETFSDRQDMVNHMVGGVLMGFGGVLGMGCTIGQGITGISTLALGSFITALSIVLGSAITMRFQYLRMDDMGVFGAFFMSIADILLPWRRLA